MNNEINANFVKSAKENRVRNGLFIFLALLLAGGMLVRNGAVWPRAVQYLAAFGTAEYAYDAAGEAEQQSSIGGDVTPEVRPRLVITPMNTSGIQLSAEGFSAKNSIAKDVETGTVLFASGEYEPHPLASITKLMSALVLLDHNLDMSTTTIASAEDVFDTFLMPGFEYQVKDLWNASLVGSSNRAVLSLIDSLNLSEEEFVRAMNQKAWELGMTDTVFTEPTGLDEGNVSTASDVVILLREIMRRAEITRVLLMPEFTIRTAEGSYEKHMWNTNWLLLGWIPHRFDVLLGGKTGHIPSAGYNFSMRVGDEKGHMVDVVVLGAESHEQRFQEARDIAQWVFGNFEWVESYEYERLP